MASRVQPVIRALSMRLALGALWLVLMADAGVGTARAQEAGDAGGAPATGTLAVRVDLVAVGGAPRGPAATDPTPAPAAARGAVVRVRVSDGSEVEEHLTDGQGQTTFALPAGDGIVYLLVDGQTFLPPPASFFSISALRDGTRVLNWSTVEIVAGQTTSIELGIVITTP